MPYQAVSTAIHDRAIRHLRDVINDECIVRVPPGSQELPALGGTGFYGWQFYLRRALLDAACLRVICADFWERFRDAFERQPFQIAGVEAASVPIITALVIDAGRQGIHLNAFGIRKQRKMHGLGNIIEGKPTDQPVTIIDDLTSPAHAAFWHAVTSIRQAGLKLSGLGYVLIRKEEASASPVIPTLMGDVRIESLFTLDDFSMSFDAYQAEKAAIRHDRERSA